MIKLVTFDLDDTLWDVRPALKRAEAAQWDWLERQYPGRIARSHKEQMANVRRQLLEEPPHLIHHISVFRERVIGRLLVAAGVSAPEAEAAAAEAFARFLRARQQVDVFAEARPMLDTIAGRYTLGALTNGNADVYSTTLGPYFTFAFKAEDVGASKPAPELFAAAANAADVAPHEIAHVGDHMEHDVEGAQRFGAKAIWFSPSGETSEQADASISCLSKLPAALLELS